MHELKQRTVAILAALVLALLFVCTPERECVESSARRQMTQVDRRHHEASPRLLGASAAPIEGGPARLRVLLISDVHGSEYNVNVLVNELREEAPFDAVLVAGDVVSIPGLEFSRWASKGTQLVEKKSSAYLPKFERILGLLAKLAARDRVYFVPGNHDPPQLFGLDGKVQGNMHGRTEMIAEGLRLVGWGGATQAVQRDSQGKEKMSWPGRPWKSEGAAAADLARLSGAAGPGEQQLLLTHCGPRGSGTTSIWRDTAANPIESGSTALLDHVRAEATTLLAVAHGHTHASGGRSSVGFVPVFNSGPLKDGEYSILTLLRSAEGRRVPTAASGPATPTIVVRDGEHRGERGVVARSTMEHHGKWAIRLASGETVPLSTSSMAFTRDEVVTGDEALPLGSPHVKWRVSSFDQRRLPGFLEQATMSCDPATNLWCQQFL